MWGQESNRITEREKIKVMHRDKMLYVREHNSNSIRIKTARINRGK